MAHPYLGFCPYLSIADVVSFAEWELGPLRAFDARWTHPRFKHRSAAFLSKFVDGQGERIGNPAILCRRGGEIDGVLPSDNEIEALSAAIAFAFLDENPRRAPKRHSNAWSVITADNTELFFWPVDLEAGMVTVTSGLMVRTTSGGYRLDDPELVIRPPLDLCYFGASPNADTDCLEAVYTVVLQSLKQQGASPQADRVRTAIGWFVKAWRNTATVHFPERLVFLKTGFEAITGTSNSWKSAKQLRALFESLPNTLPKHVEQLVWSPAETAVHSRTFFVGGKRRTELLTDLEYWFMAVADARNAIVHEGLMPDLNYAGPSSAYDGHLVFTAEYVLRAAIKVSLEGLGHPDLWRPRLEGIIKRGLAKMTATDEQAPRDGQS